MTALLLNPYILGGGAPPPLSLAAETGVFVLTGHDASLQAGQILAMDAGSYVVTGHDATFTAGQAVELETGTLVLTGHDVGLERTYALAAASGLYALAGADTGLLVSRAAVLEAGSYAVAGVAADLRFGYSVDAVVGDYVLTGEDAGLLRALVLEAETGAYAVTGIAADLVYTSGAFVPMQAPVPGMFVNFTRTAQSSVPEAFVSETAREQDPHFASVVLLVGFEGTDGQTTFRDDSNSHKTITAVNQAQVDTAQVKFGTGAVQFDGTGDRLTLSDSLDWRLSAANSDEFTVECWVRWTALDANNRGIMGQGFGSPNISWTFSGSSTIGELTFAFSNSGSAYDTTVTTSGAGMTTGVWYHVVVEKDATGKIRLYVDGVMRGSATPANSSFSNSTHDLAIGAQNASGTVDMNGHLDELRITKGVARYASDAGFTPPTAPFLRS